MKPLDSFAAVILAAGKGTRMKETTTNKVLLNILDKPMIVYTVEILEKANLSPIIVVVGYHRTKVQDILKDRVRYVVETKQLGTGHATSWAITAVPASKPNIIVFYGDHSAFYKPEMIESLAEKHLNSKAVMTFVTVRKKDPSGYGRILRNQKHELLGIREHRNATLRELKIKEINAGCYCFQSSFLRKYLPKIKKDKVKHEYYLTDLVELALKDKLRVETQEIDDEVVAVGVNTPKELEEAKRVMRDEIKK